MLITYKVFDAIFEKRKVSESDVRRLEKRREKILNELRTIDWALEKILIDCPGEAHSNSYIDYCSLCAPRWGKIIDKEKVNE